MLPDSPILVHLDSLPVDRPFTTAMAREVGVPKKALHELVRIGALRRPVRSAYVAAALPDSLELRVSLLTLVVPDGCFVTDHTAAWLHAGDKALLPNAHVVVPPPDIYRHSKTRALRNQLVRSGERRVTPDHLVTIGGIEVTTPLRTACDIGRLFTRDVAMWGLDCMLGLGVFTHEELLAFVPVFNRQRGVVQLRVLAPLTDGGAQSFGESGLRLRWYDAGLPRPRCQIPVFVDGRVVYWLDMGLEELLFAAEYDGAEWHDGDVAEARDEGRRSWLDHERSWWIEVFRRPSVFGRLQDADMRLRAAYQARRKSVGSATYLL